VSRRGQRHRRHTESHHHHQIAAVEFWHGHTVDEAPVTRG
jgi:hypothetical protein